MLWNIGDFSYHYFMAKILLLVPFQFNSHRWKYRYSIGIFIYYPFTPNIHLHLLWRFPSFSKQSQVFYSCHSPVYAYLQFNCWYLAYDYFIGWNTLDSVVHEIGKDCYVYLIFRETSTSDLCVHWWGFH